MTSQVRKRAACDRCHSQKVRCPRRPDQEVCDRCIKAQSNCVFSPFRQKKIPEGAQQGLVDHTGRDNTRDDEHPSNASNSEAHLKRKRLSPQPQRRDHFSFESSTMFEEPHHQIDPACDWMSPSFQLPDDLELEADFNFENLDMPFEFSGIDPNTYQNRLQINPADPKLRQRMVTNLNRSFRHTSTLLLGADENSFLQETLDPGSAPTIWTLPSEKVEPDPSAHCVTKLSQLSIDLFEHSKTIPLQSIHDPLAPENEGRIATQSDYAVEDTFRLTQAMIDLYPSFLAALPSQQTAGMPGAGILCIDEARTPGSVSEPIDHASILLILSCHLRLIGIYEELFKHMQVCAEQKGKAKWTVPQLQIGSYVPPPSTTLPMQMLLVLQSASRLYNYASDLAAEIPGTSSHSGSSSSAGSSFEIADDQTMLITKAAAENVRDRAGLMSEKLDNLWGKILSSGLLA